MGQKNITPRELNEMIAKKEVFLVDVREADEFAGGHIDDAILFPLSSFDPAQLPDPGSKMMVFYCAGGVRSARAVAACMQAGLPHNAHLVGGIKAWGSEELPITP